MSPQTQDAFENIVKQLTKAAAFAQADLDAATGRIDTAIAETKLSIYVNLATMIRASYEPR